MRLLVFVHLLAITVLTVYVNVYWKRAYINSYVQIPTTATNTNAELDFCCELFSGCVMQRTHGQNKMSVDISNDTWATTSRGQRNVCKRYPASNVKCTGAQRCCSDCMRLAANHVTLSHDHLVDDKIHIFFTDTHVVGTTVCGIGILCFVLVWFFLCMLKVWWKQATKRGSVTSLHDNDDDNDNNDNGGEDGEHNINRRPGLVGRRKKGLVIQHVTGFAIGVGYILIAALFIYAIGFTFNNINTLTQCQPLLLNMLSWNIIILLCFLDFSLCIVPTGVRSKGVGAGRLFKWIGRQCVNITGVLLLLWWVVIAIYLEGLIRRRWKIRF